jgi:uridine kinase
MLKLNYKGKNKPILIVIAGGTSSGKSTTVRKMEEKFKGRVVNLCAENYITREDIHLTLESSFKDHLNHHSEFNNPKRMEKERLLKDLEGFSDRKKVKIKAREKNLDGISS